MKTILEKLSSPDFENKHYYLLLLPVGMLPYGARKKLASFATKHWDKNSEFMHRLYWATKP